MENKSAVNAGLQIPPEIAVFIAIVAPSKNTAENIEIGACILKTAHKQIGTKLKQINLKDLRVICASDPETCNAAREVARTINPNIQIKPCEDLDTYHFEKMFEHLFSSKVAVAVLKNGDSAKFFEDFQSSINWPIKHSELDDTNDYVCITVGEKERSVGLHFHSDL